MLAQIFAEQYPQQAAKELLAFDHHEVARWLSLQPQETVANLISGLPGPFAVQCMESMDQKKLAAALDEIDMERAKYLYLLLSAAGQDALKEHLAHKLKVYFVDSAKFLADSVFVAGIVSTPVFLADQSVESVIDAIRKKPTRNYQYLYICDYQQKLVGVISCADLLTSSSASQNISDLVSESPATILAHQSMASAKKSLGWQNFSEISVVDSAHRHLGALKYKTLIDAMEKKKNSVQPIDGVVLRTIGDAFSESLVSLADIIDSLNKKESDPWM